MYIIYSGISTLYKSSLSKLSVLVARPPQGHPISKSTETHCIPGDLFVLLHFLSVRDAVRWSTFIGHSLPKSSNAKVSTRSFIQDSHSALSQLGYRANAVRRSQWVRALKSAASNKWNSPIQDLKCEELIYFWRRKEEKRHHEHFSN